MRRAENKRELNPVLVSALKACVTEDTIRDTFERYAVTAPAIRTDYLNAAMGDPQTFFVPKPSVDDEYAVTLQMFLTGTWKLNALYERAGL
jgi:hypothetical protein